MVYVFMQSVERFNRVCIHSEMRLQRTRQQLPVKSKFELLFNQIFYIFILGMHWYISFCSPQLFLDLNMPVGAINQQLPQLIEPFEYDI